ncbi:MAG TPA: ABC transporter ATP-binding protein [Chloroflexota bacterium]|jgi:branched-chain amino acid transport system ATP-binding protein|nr:ABC transporter ATP-binding protein [Chloroflexota bacterium]
MLECADLDVYYGDLQALWGVALQVQAGEIVALIGPNGAGKTTLMRTLAGLLYPARGTIVLDGRRVEHEPGHRRVALGMALVPEGRRLFGSMSVLENLQLGAYPGRARRERQAALDWVYSIFPILAERRHQLAGTLSGGQQQMVAIGRALMSRPRLLLLDEPSLGLAPVIVENIFQVIRQINREGVTVVLVEQNARAALRLAHRAYVIENGRVVRHDRAEALLQDDHVRQAYLGVVAAGGRA